MRSNLAAIASAVALTFLVFPARAQESTKTANIEELLKASNMESLSQQVYGQIRAMTSKQLDSIGGSEKKKAEAAQVVDKLMAQIQDRFSWDKMKPEYARLYDEVYSDAEITGILAFYRSPAGQAYLTKMPQLMAKSMEMAQRHVADIMPEIQRITKEAAEMSKDDASAK
jgi:uncharacterized protein